MPGHVWHIRDFLDINRTLDVWPVGRHDRDVVGLTKEQRFEKTMNDMRLSARFDALDPISVTDIGGPVWAFRRERPRNLKARPAMSIGGYPVVTPTCRAVLEQSDLGQVDFHRIEVLDINRKEVVWPELYVLHIRNAKHSIDMDAAIADGTLRDGAANLRTRDKKPLPPLWVVRADRTLTLQSSALEGPDLWRETQLHSGLRTNLYMSESLRTLLDEAGMAKAWGLARVAVR
ncbi:MAG: hypothetical protein AAF914_06165 [Pseudomonadota bacterium]